MLCLSHEKSGARAQCPLSRGLSETRLRNVGAGLPAMAECLVLEMFGRAGYISVIWVTAGIGSALTAGHFGKEPQSNQKALAPPLGASPRLGMPSLRLESVGRRHAPSMARGG